MATTYKIKHYLHKQSKKAFTLIELAIVLVIIGLIAGGVLVGQDLIRSAEISATVKQVQNFNAAVATFRTKYNAIPGDMGYSIAESFGFNVTGAPGSTAAPGFRDGNFIITDSSSGTEPYGETLLFWQDLRKANLISDISDPGTFNSATHAATTVTQLQSFLPAAKVGKNNHFIVFGLPSEGLNYYQIIRMEGFNAATPAYTNLNLGLSGNQAFNIDAKLDDGRPNTGIVTALTGNSSPNNNPTSIDGNEGTCASDNVSSAVYSTGNASGFDCSVKIRMQ
jgi:prepilin-type N-terminal cleavage/methylation domain-containing protein